MWFLTGGLLFVRLNLHCRIVHLIPHYRIVRLIPHQVAVLLISYWTLCRWFLTSELHSWVLTRELCGWFLPGIVQLISYWRVVRLIPYQGMCSMVQWFSLFWHFLGCLLFTAFLGTQWLRKCKNKYLFSAVLSYFLRYFSKISHFCEIFKANFPSQLQTNPYNVFRESYMISS